jgi:RHS repeat-associated protein
MIVTGAAIIGTSDSAGTSTGVGTFDDYGRYLSFAGFRFGYAGQPYETVSELQYSRARFYNPRLGGRFMQVDPPLRRRHAETLVRR